MPEPPGFIQTPTPSWSSCWPRELRKHEVLAYWLTGEAGRHWYEHNGRRYPHSVVKQLRDLEAQLTAWLSMLRTDWEFEAYRTRAPDGRASSK